MSNEASKSLAAKYKIATPSHLDPKQTIVVVEDQTDLRLIVSHQIQKLQLGTLKQAGNGYEAVELVKSHEGQKIQAFVVDWDMPVMNGLEFLTELQENPELDRGPFCLTMEQVSKERLMLAVESGVDEILVKPFTLGDIGPKLRSAFQKFHNPANPERVYELAKQLLRDGKLVESTKIYRELADAAPKAARPIVGMARNAIKQKDDDKALKLLAEAEARNKNFVHLYAERAGIYVSQEKWDEAIAEFKKAINLSPLNALRYKAAADVLFKCRRYEDSVDLLEMALKHKLEFPDLYHYLSQAKFALRDYKSAGKYIRQALSIDPQNVSYLNQLGICLKDQELFDEATKVYNQIIKLDPTNVAALYNKAMLCKSKGALDEAIKLLERALQKDPEFAEARTKLAELQKEKGSGAA
jgi:tetratricopeptide (TPR) repeat protein